MDIEKLIERLRNNNIENNCHDCALGYYAFEAAATLSTLQDENEKLRADVVRFNDMLASYQNVLVPELRAELDAYRNGHCAGGGCAAEKDRDAVLAELEQVKRERDAIEQDFRAFTKQWWEEANGFPCRFCKFEHSGGCEQKAKHPDDEKPCVGRWFEWRGPKED